MSIGTLRWYVSAFLLWCVLSSKHILIYNEETLVALSFFLFVYLTYTYAGDAIGESLDSRGQDIAQELQHYLQVRGDSLQALAQAHGATRGLGQHMHTLGHRVESLLQAYVATCGGHVRGAIHRGIDQRCHHVYHMQQGQTPRIVGALAQALPGCVLLEYAQHTDRVSQKSLETALKALA